jgi:exodeoxyribonuclease V gamma subunit
MQIFAELSRLVEINFFLLNPCREYWADILSDREIKKIRSKDPRVSENIEWYHLAKGNRLLSSLGTLGRNFFEVIADLDCEFYESFKKPEDQSLLACIQSDILLLKDREKTTAKGSISEESDKILTFGPGVEAIRFSEQDTSIQVHSCHSSMREIEVLHDNLLDMFEEDPELLPKDIIVMAPDIEAYAPYIHAVFDTQTDNALRIPYSVADQSSRKQSRMIDGFLALLELADSRFEADKVMELLAFPGIKEKFGLVEADIKTIEHWIEDTNVRWGMDADTRMQHGLPGFSENTWQAGLDRLLLGYAMAGDNKDMFHGILPFDNIEGSVAQTFGRFLEFIDRLFALMKTLLIPRKLSDWQQILLNLVDLFFLPDESGERELQLLRNLLGEFADKEKYSEFEERVDREVIRSYLNSQLQQKSYGTGFLTGGVTFCAMLPMRSIPFRVICLIGMNHDAFPRDFQPLNFDLIARYPKAGDRSRRNDDKYLFLESILSAREKLYISYVGQDIQDNSPIPPSVLVSELLDTIEDSFELSEKSIQEYIVKTHRLQSFSPWYFRSGTGLFSYSTENMLASTGGNERKTPRPFVEGTIPMTSEEAEKWQKLDINSICKFFNNPAKFFIQKRLDINLEEKQPLSKVRENFNLRALDKFSVDQNLLNYRLSESTLEDFKPIQRALGQLPHGNIGDYFYDQLSIDVENFVNKIEPFTCGLPKKSIEVDLQISGCQLYGYLSEISERGFVQVRYARKRVKDLINSWIYHLALCQEPSLDNRQNSYLICKDLAIQFDHVAESNRILEDMLTLFHQGLEEPIHFFPETSFKYAEQILRKAVSEKLALQKAQKTWLSSYSVRSYSKSESEDPYCDLCFRHLDPLDESFKKLAINVFAPLLAHCKEMILV